jgi:cytochrome P450
MTPESAWAEAMKFENRPNPYPFFDELRKTPVVRVGDGLYVVTGYRELMALAHDFGPPHTPDLIPSFVPDLKKLCDQLLDKTEGKTRMDVVDDYAYPVPVMVICKILGIPLKDEPQFHVWIHDFMAGLMDAGPEAGTKEGKARLEKGKASVAAFMQYMTDLIQGYLKKPTDAMISKLVNDNGPDGPMTLQEALANSSLLLIAGHDSTVNTISHCVLTVLRNPGTLELLRSRPGLVPFAVEEVLRMESAVQFFPSRSATDDIEVNGTVIPKGSQVHLMYGAANRDPKRFPNPNKFDVERKDNEHMGWGSGIHTCFGGPLARLEVNLALESFIRRVDNPRLVEDPPEYRRSNVFRGPRHLLIDFDRIRN